MTRFQKHFALGDLRKFAEQYGDIIQWDQSNRAYIMTHGVSGIDWKHYKHPLPEQVHNVYMQYWRGVGTPLTLLRRRAKHDIHHVGEALCASSDPSYPTPLTLRVTG